MTAFDDGEKKALIIAVDICLMAQKYYDMCKKAIEEATGICKDAIFINCSHTHTGPLLGKDFASDKGSSETYDEFFVTSMRDAAVYALADLKEATIETASSVAKNISFIRRYRMKDGGVQTNPGVNNPDIVRPVGDTDDSVNVMRFDREGADTIVFVNFVNHPDVVGGSKISADWPGLLRKDVEKIIDGTKCIFFNGAQGDVNHVNVHPKGGDFNGMFNDFDGVSRGYAHAEYIARVVTGGVLQSFDKVNYVDVDTLVSKQKIMNVPSNRPDPKDMPEAHRINDLHNAGKDNEIPFEGMMLKTVVAEAARMVRLENGPDAFDMTLSAIVIGPVAIIGIPGEPFNGVGKGLKQTEGFDMIVPCCLTNGSEGYFPMQDSYDEGGYEARSSKFKAGVAEFIIEEGQKLLSSIK